MNIEKMIRISMIELSKKYDISLIEIQTVREGRVCKTIVFNYCPINEVTAEKQSKTFFNKRDLVSWLVCLK